MEAYKCVILLVVLGSLATDQVRGKPTSSSISSQDSRKVRIDRHRRILARVATAKFKDHPHEGLTDELNLVGQSEYDVVTDEQPQMVEKDEYEGLTDDELKLIEKGELGLAWQDEFDKSIEDSQKWIKKVTHYSDNKEFQLYTDQNVPGNEVCTVEGGVLTIRPQRVGKIIGIRNMDIRQTLPYLSARLSSENTMNFNEGTLVIKAKMPEGDYLRPIFVLHPDNQGLNYVEWPKSGEIIMAQLRGNPDYIDQAGQQIGNKRLESVVIYGENTECMEKRVESTLKENGSWSDDNWHIFRFKWTKHEVVFSADSQIINRITMEELLRPKQTRDCLRNAYSNLPWESPFDRKFHLELMVAVGGEGIFEDEFQNKINNEYIPQKEIWSYNPEHNIKNIYDSRERFQWDSKWSNGGALEVDFVRLYQDKRQNV